MHSIMYIFWMWGRVISVLNGKRDIGFDTIKECLNFPPKLSTAELKGWKCLQHTNSKVMVWNSSEANKYWKCHILNSNNLYIQPQDAQWEFPSALYDDAEIGISVLSHYCLHLGRLKIFYILYTWICTYIMYPRQYSSIFNNLLKNAYPPKLHSIPFCTWQDVILLENSIFSVCHSLAWRIRYERGISIC